MMVHAPAFLLGIIIGGGAMALLGVRMLAHSLRHSDSQRRNMRMVLDSIDGGVQTECPECLTTLTIRTPSV